LEKVVTVIGSIIGICASIYTAALYIDSEINEVVEEKLKPYEQFAIANSISGEKSIESYDFVLERLLKENVDELMLVSIIERYLSEIAVHKYPHKYLHKVNWMLKLVGDAVPLTAEMSNSLGWIYLSTDNLERANHYFLMSISLYRQDESKESASSYYGLFLSHLASDKLEKAIEFHDNAWALDYVTYNPETVLLTSIDELDVYKLLFDIYPKLKGNYRKFVKYTISLYDLKVEERIKVKEVNTDILNASKTE
jgi:tetratricopeptide (TPR) repeat protein